MQRVIFVGGSKGGVGKSLISIALVDYYMERGKKCLLVETDTSNPDVFLNYKDLLGDDAIALDLDEKDGWVLLMDKFAEHKEHDIIINTAARSNKGIEEYGNMIDECAASGAIALITLWPINRQRDSLKLLKDYMSVMTNSAIYVLRNIYFGARDKFELYNTSQLREEISAKWKDFDLPDLADLVTDEMMTKRLPISKAVETMIFGSRAELERWRKDTARIFDEVLR